MAHGAPLEHRVWDISPFYRHNAPLERKTIPIVGAGFPRPTGWETQPLRIHSPSLPPSLASSLPVFPLRLIRVLRPILSLIRDSDKWHMVLLWSTGFGTYRPSIDITLRWSEKTIPIVGAGFPRPTGWETQPLRIHSPSLPPSLASSLPVFPLRLILVIC